MKLLSITSFVFLVFAVSAAGAVPDKSEASGHVYYVPGVGHTPGALGSYWFSDLTLFNPSLDAANVTLRFRGALTSDEVSTTLGARSQTTYTDVLRSVFGLTGSDGGLLIVESTNRIEVLARTYSEIDDNCTGAAASYGQSYTAIEASDALPGTNVGYLYGLRSDWGFRSNIELVNIGDKMVRVDMRFFDNDGSEIGTPIGRHVLPGRSLGVHSVLPPGYSSAYAEVQLDSSDAELIALGSVVDGVTGDSTLIPLSRGTALNGVRVGDLDGDWTVNEQLDSIGDANVCGTPLSFTDSTAYSYEVSISPQRKGGGRIWFCFDYFDCVEGTVDVDEMEVAFTYPGEFDGLCNSPVPFDFEWKLRASIVDRNLMRGTLTQRYVLHPEGGQPVEWLLLWNVVLTR